MSTTQRIRALPRFLVLWTALLVVLAGAAGALAWKTHSADRTAAAGAAALHAAEKYTVELLSYEPREVKGQLLAATEHLTGRFREDFEQLAETTVVPAAKRDGITTRAEVVAKAIVSASTDRVVTLVFVNMTTESKVLQQPRLDGSRLRVTLVNVQGEWLISDLTPV